MGDGVGVGVGVGRGVQDGGGVGRGDADPDGEGFGDVAVGEGAGDDGPGAGCDPDGEAVGVADAEEEGAEEPGSDGRLGLGVAGGVGEVPGVLVGAEDADGDAVPEGDGTGDHEGDGAAVVGAAVLEGDHVGVGDGEAVGDAVGAEALGEAEADALEVAEEGAVVASRVGDGDDGEGVRVASGPPVGAADSEGSAPQPASTRVPSRAEAARRRSGRRRTDTVTSPGSTTSGPRGAHGTERRSAHVRGGRPVQPGHRRIIRG